MRVGSDSAIISSQIKILKGGWIQPPPKGFKHARIDNNQQGKKHIHIYKNHEYIVINTDGTKHHDKDKPPIRISRQLYDWIQENFDDFNLPENRLIQFKLMLEKPKYDYSIIFDIQKGFYMVY